jgi:hypothetical protein
MLYSQRRFGWTVCLVSETYSLRSAELCAWSARRTLWDQLNCVLGQRDVLFEISWTVCLVSETYSLRSAELLWTDADDDSSVCHCAPPLFSVFLLLNPCTVTGTHKCQHHVLLPKQDQQRRTAVRMLALGWHSCVNWTVAGSNLVTSSFCPLNRGTQNSAKCKVSF